MSAAIDLDRDLRERVQGVASSVREAFSDTNREPCVTCIEYTIDRDWSGDDAVHFTVTIADPRGSDSFGHHALSPIEDLFADCFVREGIARIPYVLFQTHSEAKALANNDYFAAE